MRLPKVLAFIILLVAAGLLVYFCIRPDIPEKFKNTVSVAVPSQEIYPEDIPLSSETVQPSQKTSSAEIIPTTISGGLVVKNSTSYEIDVSELMSQACPVKLSKDEPQVLIIHTHSSEAYSPAGLDLYVDSGASRTQDNNYNVIRIGSELEKILKQSGLKVIHDCGVYDYPSYAGSYGRCEEAIRGYLEKYPSISIVIDLHRDAIGNDDVVYKTVAAEEGVCASQIMILIGTDEYGLEHPKWTHNLRLALYMQNAVLEKYPSLMRPIQLVPYRYNQQLTTGSMILEVGSNGNTLQEALAAIRLFGKAVGPALYELVE